MATEWIEKKILITVRTYPVPATKGVEISCTAGISTSGEWIRLFPIPYRLLDDDKQFRKFQWVTVSVTKAKNDSRPESYNPRVDHIKIGETLTTKNEWRARWDVVGPLLRPSMCAIQAERDLNGAPTLGLFKPTITRLLIEPITPDWTPKQQEALKQTLLFQESPEQPLEKIPYDFKYEFRCNNPSCNMHTMLCTDWEMGQSYRRWRRQYGAGWEAAFRQTYEHDMIQRYDTHFFVGNLHQFPNAWIVVGLFYPPRQATGDLFAKIERARG
jgi:hypothetical protein